MAYSLSPEKGAALASAPLTSPAGRPQAGSYADRLPRFVRVRLPATRRLLQMAVGNSDSALQRLHIPFRGDISGTDQVFCVVRVSTLDRFFPALLLPSLGRRVR